MKDYISYACIFVVAVLFVVGAAVWEGFLTDRWEWADVQDPKLESMKAGIRNIPHMVGDWNGDISTERREMDDIIAKEAGAEESLARTYTHVGVARPVSINIICGSARKVAIHTPDACYKGAGFHIVGDIEKIKFPYTETQLVVGDEPAEDAKPGEEAKTETKTKTKTGYFKTAVFEKESPLGVERQRVFWGWKSAESGWEAPELARQRWTKGPLSKLYFSTPESPEDKLQDNPAFLFAKALLPELDVLLSGEFSAAGESSPEEITKTQPAPGPTAAESGAPVDMEKPVSDTVSPFISTPLPPAEDNDPLFPETAPATDTFLPELPLPETNFPPEPDANPDALPVLDTGAQPLPELDLTPPPTSTEPDSGINRLPPLPF